MINSKLLSSKLLSLLIAGFFAAPVFAQTVATDVQRDVNQQTRIEDGLKSGQLTTKEAGKLEHEEAAVSHAEANAMKNGTVSAREQKRLTRLQNKASKDIHAEKTDAKTGNANSASSKRMQADVLHNINQQTRIENGVKSGELTTHETAKLEKGQASSDRQEANAAKDGHVGAVEQAKVRRADARQSKRIHHEKHDEKTAG